MQSGRILYAVHQGTYILKLEGEVRVPLCTSLDGFLERMFLDQKLSGVFIDLTESVIVDSTTLGLLAKISVFLREHSKHRPVILSTQPDITRVLKSMGFEQVFVILEKAPSSEADALVELPLVTPSEAEVTHQVIDAHRTLMSLNVHNQQIFSNLVETLETEQHRLGLPPCT